MSLGPIGASAPQSVDLGKPATLSVDSGTKFAQLVLFEAKKEGRSKSQQGLQGGKGGQGYGLTNGTISTLRHTVEPISNISQEKIIQVAPDRVNIKGFTGDPAATTREVSLTEIRALAGENKLRVAYFDTNEKDQFTGTTQVVLLQDFKGKLGLSGAPVFDGDFNLVGHYSGINIDEETKQVNGYNFFFYGAGYVTIREQGNNSAANQSTENK